LLHPLPTSISRPLFYTIDYSSSLSVGLVIFHIPSFLSFMLKLFLTFVLLFL
jgi:hypothetical protein